MHVSNEFQGFAPDYEMQNCFFCSQNMTSYRHYHVDDFMPTL